MTDTTLDLTVEPNQTTDFFALHKGVQATITNKTDNTLHLTTDEISRLRHEYVYNRFHKHPTNITTVRVYARNDMYSCNIDLNIR